MLPTSATPDRHLHVAGALLRYRDEGSGPPVLFIHGWTLDLDMWEPQVAELGGSFRLVRFDRRGFGLSGGRASLAADVEDALSLCDTLQLERLACVGMSQGARVALRLCRIAPERLSCVVLDGPPRMLAVEDAGQAANDDENVAAGAPANETADDSTDDAENIPLADYRALIGRGDIETFRRAWATHPLMQLETSASQPRALLARMTDRYSGRDLQHELPASEDHWNRATLSSLRTPALIITGEHDLPSRVRAADALATALPVAQRATISTARHIPNLDNSQSYNVTVRSFLERHIGSRP